MGWVDSVGWDAATQGCTWQSVWEPALHVCVWAYSNVWLPGKPIQCLKQTETENPIILLDEVRLWGLTSSLLACLSCLSYLSYLSYLSHLALLGTPYRSRHCLTLLDRWTRLAPRTEGTLPLPCWSCSILNRTLAFWIIT